MDVKVHNTPSCPVDDLLYLIQQDDIESLRDALLDLVEKNHPGGEVYLYEHGYSIFNSSNKIFSPVLLGARGEQDIRNKRTRDIRLTEKFDSIHFDGFKFLPENNYIQVFPVESNRATRGLLITINQDIVNENYINILLNAYDNQVYLLRNKDADSLTGLYNRQSFDAKLDKLHKNFGAENRADDIHVQYALALLDIDFFKSVNDKYGHVYGDEVLLLFSNLMKSTFRENDLLFRYGGEEFAVLLHNVDCETAESILNRFRENVEHFLFPMENKVTTSIGYCSFNDSIPLSLIIDRADKALYYAKDHGRNKTYGFEALAAAKEVEDIMINEGDIELF